MTRDELLGRVSAGTAPAILDVRTPREFAEGHVPGAVNLPFNEVAARAGGIASPKHAALVVYCGHGPRAWIAARALRRAGFTAVEYLRGHMAGWRRARLPEERATS